MEDNEYVGKRKDGYKNKVLKRELMDERVLGWRTIDL